MKAVILALFLAVSLVSCTNYGKKVKSGNVEVYYKDGISEKEAQQTANLLFDALKESGGNTNDKKSIQLTRGERDTIMFRMVVQESKLKSVSDDSFTGLAAAVSDAVFQGKPVNVELTDNSFKTIRTIYFAKAETNGNNGDNNNGDTNTNNTSKATAGNVEVYAQGGVSQAECQALADYLNPEIGQPDHTVSFGFQKDDNGDYTVKMVSQPDKMESLSDQDLKDMASKIATNVTPGYGVTFELTDAQFNMVRKAKYAEGAAN